MSVDFVTEVTKWLSQNAPKRSLFGGHYNHWSAQTAVLRAVRAMWGSCSVIDRHTEPCACALHHVVAVRLIGTKEIPRFFKASNLRR